MKRMAVIIAVVLTLAGGTEGQTDSEQLLTQVAKDLENALVMVTCEYEGETGKTTLEGVGVCYEPARGDFLTLALAVPRFRPDKIERLSLILPGPERESVGAEFLGMRAEVGIAFVRAKERRNWKGVKFAARSNLRVGQKVVSGGLMPGSNANTPYVGLGYVSGILRVPQHVCYVTGGRLTCAGSPVFAPDGLAIGLVAKNLYMEYQMPTARGPSNVSLKGRQESPFFLPVEEFGFVLERIPQDGSVPRPSWMGVLTMQGISDQQAEFMDLQVPAVAIDQVIPGGPGEKAGLKNGDVIVAIDSRPIEQLASADLTGRNALQKIMLLPPGSEVTVSVRREGKVTEVSLKLEQMPVLPEEAARYIDEKLGLAVREKVPIGRYLLKSPTAKIAGLAVIGVGPRTPAANGGLQPGDVITALNGQPVRTVEVFKKILGESLAKDPSANIVLMVCRGREEPQSITIRPPQPEAELPLDLWRESK